MEFLGKPLFPTTIAGLIALLLLLIKNHYLRPNYLSTGSITILIIIEIIYLIRWTLKNNN